MRIVIVVPALTTRGGAENIVVWIAGDLARRGHKVKVVTSRLVRANFPHCSWPFEVVEIGGEGGAATPRGMREAGRRLRPHLVGADVINPHQYPANFWTHWANPPTDALLVWLCQDPVKRLYTPPLQPHFRELMARRNHESRSCSVRLRRSWTLLRALSRLRRITADRLTRSMDAAVAREFDAVLVNSHFVAEQLKATLGIDATVLTLGVPTVPPAPPPDFPGKELVSVARLWPEKNLETILKAMAIVRASAAPDAAAVRLTVIGTGPDSAYLHGLRDELGLQGAVHFAGAVDEARLDHQYRRACGLVLLPLDESFGLVFAEAGMRARPCIGPDHGGPVEIIDHGRTGLVVDALDTEAVARAILDLLGDPERARQMGLAAWNKIQAEHSVEAMTTCFLGIVADLSGTPGRPA